MSSMGLDRLVRRCLVHLILWGVVALAGCASGTEGDGGIDGSTPDRDAGPIVEEDGGPPEDAGPPTDAGEVDGGVVDCTEGSCAPFQYCDSGVCRDYPACRGDGTCDVPGDVCHNRFCVPGDVDVDGDGYTADVDCDETNEDINPGAEEICNDTDDNCDMSVDEGDPTALCEFYPGGGICMDGNCGCTEGLFDLDPVEPGCECAALPALGMGNSCLEAIDVGDVADIAVERTQRGNVLPDDREVWYRFRGVDGTDGSGDTYFVDVHFNENPDNTFEFTVFQNSCGDAPSCADVGFTTYSDSYSFRQTIAGTLTGHAPCWSGTPVANVSGCTNNTTTYFVRVRRRAGSNLSCAEYEISFNNGVRTGAPPT